uniref:T-lymphoma invasion and metastasis-inducing protein 2 n=1 Tax=Sphaerodactylus townsendi TaxID=933632 RepID=A0ACB8GBS9_9SAUR
MGLKFGCLAPSESDEKQQVARMIIPAIVFDIYDEIEVIPLNLYHVHLTKSGGVTDFGFAVTAQVDEHQHLTQIFVSDVLPDGMAYQEGLRVGNEILIINGESITDLDLRQMELLFSEKSVTLTLSSSHNSNKSALCTLWSDGDISKEPRNVLPPPNQSQLLEEFLDNFKKNTTNGLIYSLQA